VDGSTSPFAVDAAGSYNRDWNASDLDYGTHRFQAFFDGQVPYASSASNIVVVVISIPTNITITLVQTRVFIEHHIIGEGVLYCNGTTPLPGKEVTISIDGDEVLNLTTDESGGFVFLHPASSVGSGWHTLRAAFLHREDLWRYSEAELEFSIYVRTKAPYPFFPFIPDWGRLFAPGIPDLLIGEYAYIVWLLILLTLAVAVRILRTRKRKKEVGETIAGINLEPLRTAPSESLKGPALTPELFMNLKPPKTPNGKIIWYYQNLLGFLKRKRNIAITPSMTHWELAKLLKSFGYPAGHVETMTMLFEKALYSGTQLAQSDIVTMSLSFGNIIGMMQGGAKRAV
jgi:hypothetical protein